LGDCHMLIIVVIYAHSLYIGELVYQSNEHFRGFEIVESFFGNRQRICFLKVFNFAEIV
jgi:hypothetical protein